MITPTTFPDAISGTDAKADNPTFSLSSRLMIFPSSNCATLKEFCSLTVLATIHGASRGILIVLTISLSLDEGTFPSFIWEETSSKRPIPPLEYSSQTLHASSNVSGPTPIIPWITLLLSFTRKSIALLNPRPSPIVTAVRMMCKSLSSFMVVIMAVLMSYRTVNSLTFFTASA